MDDASIDVAITSVSSPGVHVGDDARARSLARRCNELAGELIQARPDRFGGFAALPLPDVDGALEELSYAIDVLKLDGVVLFSNACGAAADGTTREWQNRTLAAYKRLTRQAEALPARLRPMRAICRAFDFREPVQRPRQIRIQWCRPRVGPSVVASRVRSALAD